MMDVKTYRWKTVFASVPVLLLFFVSICHAGSVVSDVGGTSVQGATAPGTMKSISLRVQHDGQEHTGENMQEEGHGNGHSAETEKHAKNGDHGGGHGSHGVKGTQENLPVFWVLPFVGILLSIAVFPLFAPEFWHHHYGKISAAWALLLAIPYLFVYQKAALHDIVHIILIDYIPFIVLLGGLFTITGGIVVAGKIKGTPLTNTSMIGIGTIAASWIGTTGAAVLMIRPLIRANKYRSTLKHIVIFFIFLVANIGGSLTPVGDPPLFLGFLHGVPFFWTLRYMLLPMLFVVVFILLFFFLFDWYMYKQEDIDSEELENSGTSGMEDEDGESTDEDLTEEERELAELKQRASTGSIRLLGWHNLFFMVGMLAAIILTGQFMTDDHMANPKWIIPWLEIPYPKRNIVRDVCIVIMSVLAYTTTKEKYRKMNGFTWFPIKEVAKLFAGIFVTMVPCLAILKAGDEGALSFMISKVEKPFHYFWITGILSSFLDNAPTYFTFFNMGLGSFPEITEANIAKHIYGYGETFYPILLAISTGSVFMGAMTYIGNAPNFMVKSISEENDVEMPSFFGYMIWSGLILLPLFVLFTFIWFVWGQIGVFM